MEKYLQLLNKFDGIYPITAKMKKKEKGNVFETFTYHLIKHDPRLNNGLEKIWMFNDIPKNILAELNLPSTDKGIDLLAIINGKYYAIQCKFRQDPNKIISWGELSTFFGLSFGMNNKIAGGFFVTNTRNLCQEVINSKKVTAIYDDFYDDLTSNFFENIMSDKIKYERKHKNAPQIECVTAARIHYFENKRGYIEMACGTGKTLASYWIACSMSLGRTVIFVPSLQLLSQFYSDWVNQSYAEEKNLKYLLIGSDADVEDEIIEKSNGLMLHLNPDEIRKHLSEDVVVICTYQSSDKLAEACGKKITFDFGIFDEAHKTVGQKEKQFSRMLFDDELKINKRLFMTATPKIYVGKNDDIVSMDNKEIYGARIYTYNTSQAIENKMLTDYQVLSIYATDKSIMRDIKANKLVKFKKEFDAKEAKYLAIMLVILKKIYDGTINRLITYHNTIANAKRFAEFLCVVNRLMKNEQICINSIDGTDSIRARKNIIREFSEAKIGILCSARVLNEGVNIPAVDSICFVDARESTIDITQCIGRCLRLYEGKNMAYVIVPIFIKDFEEDFNKSNYHTPIKILKAMKNTDNDIVEYFKMKGHCKINKRNIMCNENYDVIYESKEIVFDEWRENVDCKLWEIIDTWNYMYDLVKKWIERKKNSKNTANLKLIAWCTSQRIKYKDEKLSNERIELLNNIDGWRWDPFLDAWNNKYADIQTYIYTNNKFPIDRENNNQETILARWAGTQRMSKNKKSLIDEQIKKLEELPGWTWGFESWETRYLKLQKFIEINDKLPSKHTKNKEEYTLARWVGSQRLKNKDGNLTDDQFEKLDALNIFLLSRNDIWMQRYLDLKKYININKKYPSRSNKDTKSKFLGGWIRTQRDKKKNKKLSPKKIKILESLPNWFWVHGTTEKKNISFDDKYLALKKWIETNKRMPLKNPNDVEENALHLWRRRQKSGDLSNDKIDMLEALDGWIWAVSVNKKYDIHFNELKEWVAEYDKLPLNNAENKTEKFLYSWMTRQRKAKRNDNLSNEQILKFEEIKRWRW
uniref:Helicase n=1 Tax=viral metagenome TaxID=1070528 RepID=A0A6C0C9Z7_9ZZZZ